MISLGPWERRLGFLSFPGFLRYYAVMHVMVFILQWIRPDVGQLLEFNRARILSGEIWRMATCFFAYSEFGGPSPVNLIFLVCAMNFAFMVSDGLEGAWGEFKTSMFYYLGMGLILVANFAYPYPVAWGGFALYGAAFLAFATLFPKVEILLFFILPVPVGLLGIIEAVAIGVMVVSSPGLLPFVLIAFTNYFIWAGIPALRGSARIMEATQRKKRFNAAKNSEQRGFHTCAACDRTDTSDPEMEFRVGRDGREYCDEHLPESGGGL